MVLPFRLLIRILNGKQNSSSTKNGFKNYLNTSKQKFHNSHMQTYTCKVSV